MAEQKGTPDANGLTWSDAPAATVTTSSPAPASSPNADANGLVWNDPNQSSNPTADTEDKGVLYGAYHHTAEGLVSTGQLLKQLWDEPTWEGQRRILGSAIGSMVNAQTDLAKQGAGEISDAYQARHAGVSNEERAATYYQGGAHMVESGIPGAGPQLAETQRDLTEKPNQGAGELLGDLATALLPKAVSGAKSVAADISTGAKTAPIRSLAGLIAKSPGMGDNFDPKATANDVAPLIQQAAKANPELLEEATSPKSSPEQSYKAFQKLANEAQTHIDEAHNQALGEHRSDPASPQRVLDAIDKAAGPDLAGMSPSDAAAVKDLKARVANAKTLGQLNSWRKYLTDEISPEFRKDDVASGRSGTMTKVMRSALNATRDTYYDALQQATGQDFRTLKRYESSLLTYQEALGNSRRGLFAAQAEHEAPTTVKQKAAKAGSVVGAVISGDKGKLAQTALNEAPMAMSQAHIRRFLKTIPEGVPGEYTASSGYAPNNPRLPANASPETVTAQTTPNPGRPNIPTQEVSDAGGPANGLPSGEGARTSGQSPNALPKQASSSKVDVPSQPYPKLNQSTAADRTARPLYPKPKPTETKPVNVTPEGQAHIQRPSLPQPSKVVVGKKAKKILGGS